MESAGDFIARVLSTMFGFVGAGLVVTVAIAAVTYLAGLRALDLIFRRLGR